MDEKTLIKKKNELMKSIMSDPKLSKQFRDAINAPVGSTKRTQSKSIFSIMGKVKGIKPDGKGGMFDTPAPSYTPPSNSNYNNLFTFPSTGPLKKINTFLGMPETTPTPAPVTPKPKTNYPNIFEGVANIFKLPEGYKAPTPYVPKSIMPDFGNFGIKDVGTNILNTLQGKPVSASTPINTAKPVNTTTYTPPVEDKTKANMSYAPVVAPAKTNVVDPNKVIPVEKPTTVIPPPTGNGLMKNSMYFDEAFKDINAKTPISIAGLSTNASFTDFTNALINQESGGDYSAVSPSGAMGKYQIMPFNLGYAGLTDTPANRAKFLASPELQDKAFTGMINELYTKYNGDLAKVAAAYYGGAGGASNLGLPAGDRQGKYDKNTGALTGFPSVNEYVNQVLGRMTGVELGGELASAETGGGEGMTFGDIQKYVDAGTGSYTAGQALAQSQYGGRNLTEVIMDNKKAFEEALTPLELELSKLKGLGANFVPTITQYMQGRDEYSKALDGMINEAQKQLATMNMGDTTSVNAAKSNLVYLTTLKGRQNSRYTNYLTMATKEYENDVTNLQNRYDSFYKTASDALTQQNTLDQTTYNNLMTQGASVYEELASAPDKAINSRILQLELIAAGGATAVDGISSAVITDDKYLDKVKTVLESITYNKGVADATTGSLDWTKLPVDGLIGIYLQNGGLKNNAAITEGIRQALATTLEGNNNPAVAYKVKALIDNLVTSPDEGMQAAGNELARQLIPNAETSWSSSIASKISDVKSAMEDLVLPYGGVMGWGAKKSGLENKSQWMSKHSTLGTELLEALYNTAQKGIAGNTTWSNDPKQFIAELFSGTDAENAKSVARAIAVTA